ncbi:MAG: cysteine hydrolase family protein [Candidatus Promineifilaceae bacterium]|nr:cysteine hydrolase family protein [Candidatus Promineifilaceae bacterium]
MREFPDFYNPDRIGSLHYPDMTAIAAAAERANLPPASADGQRVQLLLVDMQVDFCHEAGTLYVPGALEDIRRVIEFVFRHGAAISDITCTLDSHLPFQIFHPPWWVDADGNHPEPLTIISAEDVEQGRWRPLVKPDYSREYVQELEARSKKQLTIWPYHVLIGGMGNALDPQLWATVMWHALARKSQPTWLVKGRVPHTEHYSAVQPEINDPTHPQGGVNEAFLRSLRQYDVTLVAGEAESHCVLETLEDIVAYYEDTPDVLERIYVLQDCTSPVQHPEVDFHALAMERFAKFAEVGVSFIDSTGPLPAVLSRSETRDFEPEDTVAVSGLQRMGEWERENVAPAADSAAADAEVRTKLRQETGL